jgi:hypothetical protein
MSIHTGGCHNPQQHVQSAFITVMAQEGYLRCLCVSRGDGLAAATFSGAWLRLGPILRSILSFNIYIVSLDVCDIRDL